jgi:hypothetical protein
VKDQTAITAHFSYYAVLLHRRALTDLGRTRELERDELSEHALCPAYRASKAARDVPFLSAVGYDVNSLGRQLGRHKVVIPGITFPDLGNP